MFNGAPGDKSSTSGCPRLTKCGYNKLCTGTLSFGDKHACRYDFGQVGNAKGPDASALVEPKPQRKMTVDARADNNKEELAGVVANAEKSLARKGRGGSVKLPGASFLEVGNTPLAHVPRVEIDPTRGAFGAYKYTVNPPESMCAPYAPFRPKDVDERALNPAWQIFEDANAKDLEERFQPMWRPLA